MAQPMAPAPIKVMRDIGGGPASSPRKARKNLCAVAGNDTAASMAAQRKRELESCDEARNIRSLWSATLKAKVGDGTIQDLAISLAGHYHVPVVVEAGDVTHHVTWNFGSSDPLAAATQAVSNDGFSVDQRSGGLIKILDR